MRKKPWRRILRSLAASVLILCIASAPTTTAQNSAQILNFPYYDDTPEVIACGGSLTGTDNAAKAFNFFVSKGYQPFQAAGIVGNMMYESGVLPQRLQGTGADVVTPAETLTAGQLSDGSLGWGIVQFTPPGMFINTFTNKHEANGFETQLEFVWNQLEGNPPLAEKRAGEEIKGTTSLEEAVKAFQGTRLAGGQYFGYERPGDQSGTIAERTANAQKVLTEAGAGTSAPGSAGSCGGVGLNGCPTAPISINETVVVAGNVRVHPCISGEVERIVALANSQGLNMGGGGYRDPQQQIDTRRANCGTSDYDIYEKPSGDCNPPTATPGTSRHETGTAVDFTCGENTIPSRSHPCFTFLENNTSLINLDSEPWHWSDNGN